MERSLKVTFDAPFDKTKECAILSQLVTTIAGDTSSMGVRLASQLALSLIARPTQQTYDLLTDLNPDPSYTEADFYRLRQIQALFSKRENIPGIEVDRRQAALDKFLESEEVCYQMNRSLRTRAGRNDRAALFLHMQRKIADILGTCPTIDDIPFAFGPGSNVGCSKLTSVRRKLMAPVTATEGAAWLFEPLVHQFNAWPGLNKLRVVHGSNWTSVPKSFKTDRGINVEPILNSFVQKGIGRVIREKLRNVGVNLDDQQPNQLLAQLGSTMYESQHGLATIDLSMASDNISYQLVLELLPLDWFSLLDSFRSPMVKMPNGRYRVLEKFSSMGNGYTFELESLIFYAVLSVVCGDDEIISVYGDDLICPTKYYDQVLDALHLIGATVNTRKSFASGPFRESCGKDFWKGTNVRPCFLKSDLSIKEIFRLHNYFRRTGWIDPGFLIDHIPTRARLYGPDGCGDGHLLGETPIHNDKRGWMGFYRFKTYQAIPLKRTEPLESDAGAALYGISGRYEWFDEPTLPATSTMFTERSMRPRYRVCTIRVPAVT